MKFNIGDEVEYYRSMNSVPIVDIGSRGIVLEPEHKDMNDVFVGVVFDGRHDGNTLGGKLENCSGFYLLEENLRLVEQEITGKVKVIGEL